MLRGGRPQLAKLLSILACIPDGGRIVKIRLWRAGGEEKRGCVRAQRVQPSPPRSEAAGVKIFTAALGFLVLLGPPKERKYGKQVFNLRLFN